MINPHTGVTHQGGGVLWGETIFFFFNFTDAVNIYSVGNPVEHMKFAL